MRKSIYMQRIKALQQRLSEKGLSAWLITMDDPHGSEYTKEPFHTIARYSGFTGSAGTLLVLPGEAFFWTDGRYFLQAEKELEGSGISLMRSGLPEVPTVSAFIADLAEKAAGRGEDFRLGFDGSCVMLALTGQLRTAFEKKCTDPALRERFLFFDEEDLAGKLWEEDHREPRPALTADPVWELSPLYAGESREQKLEKVLGKMQEKNADALILCALDQIAWLFNLRGSDIAYNPVFFAFCVVRQSETVLYLKTKEYPKILEREELPVTLKIRSYEKFFEELALLPEEARIWVDPAAVPERVFGLLQKNRSGEDLITEPSPISLLKAVKNKTEIENMKAAHVADGAAVTKWIYAVKTGNRPLTELSAAALLEDFRKENENYLGQSFAPILAFREHGAIVHYEPTPETDAAIERKEGDLLLADTGGHYLTGTTDCTRTLALGTPTHRQKRFYTAVLAGHLSLLDAVFLEGAPGSSLDQLAREPLYRLGLDYRHGTGHGVGYLLCVHEGPNAFRMKHTKDNVILPGMITSDEPGVYLEGEFGIRLESLVLSEPFEKTEYGSFLHFVPLTMIPFERSCILPEELTDRQIRVLNDYHRLVYETLLPHLTQEEAKWLSAECAPF